MEQNSRQAFIDKGEQRLKRLETLHRQKFTRPLRGRILDFGCGAGGLLLAGRQKGLDIHGVEVEPVRLDQYRHYSGGDEGFILYDGRDLPYSANEFDTVITWFVFEHVTDPIESLRQIARVLKPGGTLMLFADEAGNGWEGHPQIPWPPFMPRRFTEAYLDEWDMADRTPFINEHCFYVTSPMLAAALEAFGVRVMERSDPPASPYPATINILTEADARAAAREAKDLVAAGAWRQPTRNLEIFAVKSGQGGT